MQRGPWGAVNGGGEELLQSVRPPSLLCLLNAVFSPAERQVLGGQGLGLLLKRSAGSGVRGPG